ncbi:hypothetical protein RSAG8_09436, partial [Rhizoctonia solani AG-8 WAC10335]
MLALPVLLLAAATTVLGHGYVQEVVGSSGNCYKGLSLRPLATLINYSLPLSSTSKHASSSRAPSRCGDHRSWTWLRPGGRRILWKVYCDPYTTPAPQRIIRKFPSNGPVQDVKSMDIQCNVGAVPAPITASFAAGSNVALYVFDDPYTTPAPQRIIRKFPSNGPVQDVQSMDIQCNVGAVPAPILASFAAGSNVALNWTTWPESHVGPLITYMARAPSDVTKWSPGTSAVWFKIDEQGLSNGKWAATDVLTENKSIYTFKIPASLKAGQYLIRHEIIALHSGIQDPCLAEGGTVFDPATARHEIIALHSASSEGGAQFYPSCTQVQVTGSGTETGPASLVAFPGAYKSTDPGILYNAYGGSTTYPIHGLEDHLPETLPTASLVAFPGAYKSTDPGILYNAYGGSTTYPIPGPPVWTGGSSSGNAPAPVTSPTTANTTPRTTTAKASSPTTAPSGSGSKVPQYGQCAGRTYSGPTVCTPPQTCKYNNDYYSQCL